MAPWADEHLKDARQPIRRHYAELSTDELNAVDLSAQDPHMKAMYIAAVVNDPAAYRTARKGWQRAGPVALETAKRGVA